VIGSVFIAQPTGRLMTAARLPVGNPLNRSLSGSGSKRYLQQCQARRARTALRVYSTAAQSLVLTERWFFWSRIFTRTDVIGGQCCAVWLPMSLSL